MRVRGPIAPKFFKRHPLTGEVITPVGYRKDGRPIMPIMGGAPDGDDDDDDGDKDDDTGDSGSGDSKDSKDDKADDSGVGSISAEEAERLRKRMQAADKRADEAAAALKKIEDEKKDDLTKATDRAQELESENEQLKAQIKAMQLQNAFLSANKHPWHDPDEALASAERNGYLEDVVDDDGKVDKVRLGKALDRLAKEKAFLVNATSKKNDDPDEPSGEPAGGRSDNGKDEKAKKEQLRKRFPVLNR